MPAKSTSPEAAQQRVWKAEIKDLEKRRRLVCRDFRVELTRLHKANLAARRALAKYEMRLEKLRPRALAEIQRRIAFLTGRIGV